MSNDADTTDGRLGGVAGIAAVVALTTAMGAASALAHRRLFGTDIAAYPDHLSAVVSVPFSVVVVVGTWAVLRREGLSLGDVGLGRRRLLPGVGAFVVVWAGATATGAGYLTATGETDAFGLAAGMPWYWVPVWFVLMLTISNGVREEFVFRAYVQTRATDLLDVGSDRRDAAAGIVVAALLFGVPHVPLAFVIYDASPLAIPFVLLGNLLPGLVYGLLYYLTRNVWYVGFVHGFANAVLVPFDAAAVPAFRYVAGAVALVVAVAYRRRYLATDAASKDGAATVEAAGAED